MSLCREKIRGARAQLELNLATSVKGNKNFSMNTVANKRRVQENPHPFGWGRGRSTVIRIRMGYLMPSLLQSLIVRAVVLWVPNPWAERWGQGTEWSPHKSWGLGKKPATALGHTQLQGVDGIHPRVLRELMEELTEPPSIIYQQSCLPGGSQLTGSWWMGHPHQKMFFSGCAKICTSSFHFFLLLFFFCNRLIVGASCILWKASDGLWL